MRQNRHAHSKVLEPSRQRANLPAVTLPSLNTVPAGTGLLFLAPASVRLSILTWRDPETVASDVAHH